MIEELKKTFDTFNKKMSVWEIQHNKREENFKKFVEAGLPTKKLEDWKFSNFNQIISNNLKNLNIDLDEWLDLKTRIPELNKNKINSPKDIIRIIDEGLHKVGDEIILTVLRQNQSIDIRLILEEPKSQWWGY